MHEQVGIGGVKLGHFFNGIDALVLSAVGNKDKSLVSGHAVDDRSDVIEAFAHGGQAAVNILFSGEGVDALLNGAAVVSAGSDQFAERGEGMHGAAIGQGRDLLVDAGQHSFGHFHFGHFSDAGTHHHGT